MVKTVKLGEYLEQQFGINAAPRDLYEERRIAEDVGFGPLLKLDDTLKDLISAVGIENQVLEDLALTNIPNGFGEKQLKEAVITYFTQRGFPAPRNRNHGVLIFSDNPNKETIVTSSYLPDNSFLLTVQENRFGLLSNRN